MPKPEWKPDFDRTQKTWENAVRQFPHLSSLGPSPIEDDGRFTGQAVQAIYAAFRYPTRSPLEGYTAPEMQIPDPKASEGTQIISGNLGIKGPAVPMPEAQAPPPVDWVQRALDIAAPIASLATPLSYEWLGGPEDKSLSDILSDKAKRREASGAMEVTPPGFKPGQTPQDVMTRRAEEASRRKPAHKPARPEESRPMRLMEAYRDIALPLASIFFTGLEMEDIDPGYWRRGDPLGIRGKAFDRLNDPDTNPYHNERAAEYKRQLVAQGYGYAHASQSAYQQALDEGHIPWWHTLIVEGILDPIEMLPIIGKVKHAPELLRMLKNTKKPVRELIKDIPSDINKAFKKPAAEEALVPVKETDELIASGERRAEVLRRLEDDQIKQQASAAEEARRFEEASGLRESKVEVRKVLGKRDYTVSNLDDQGNVISAQTIRTKKEAVRIARASGGPPVEVFDESGTLTKSYKAKKGWVAPEPREVPIPAGVEVAEEVSPIRGFVEKPGTGVPDLVKPVDEVKEVAEEAVEMIPAIGLEDPAITDLLARIPEAKKGLYKNPEARTRGIERAERNVKEALRKAIEKVEEEASRFHPSWSPARGVDGLTARDLKKITDNTGASAAEVREAIRTAMTGVPVAATEEAGILASRSRATAAVKQHQAEDVASKEAKFKLVEDYHDDQYLMRYVSKLGKKEGVVIPETGTEIKPGSIEDLENAVSLFPGNTQAVVAITEKAVKNAQDILKGVKTRTGEAVNADDLLDEWLTFKHGQEVFRHKKKRKFYGPFTNKADLDNAERGIRNKLGVEGVARLESAAEEIVKLYRRDLQRYVDEGMISADHARELREKYPHYNPLRYVEYSDKLRSTKPGARHSVEAAISPIGRLGETGKERELASPLSALTVELIRNEQRIRINQIKRTMIRTTEILAQSEKYDPQVVGVKRSNPVKLVAWEEVKGTGTAAKEAEQKAIFRPHGDGKNNMSFFTPENPGNALHYEVPPWMVRELSYLEDIYQPAGLMMWLAAPNAILRGSFVTYNPPFIVANVLNDTFTAGITEGVLPHQVGMELIRGLGHMMGTRFSKLEALQNPVWGTYAGGRGRQAKFYGKGFEDVMKRNVEQGVVERGNIAKRAKQGVKEIFDPASMPAEDITPRIKEAGGTVVTAKGLLDGALGMGASLARVIPALGEVGEMAPRVAAMRKSMNKSRPGWKMQLDSGAMTPQQLADTDEARAAIQAGIDATINFSRGGRVIKQANKYFLFLNAASEGMKLPARAVTRNPARFARTMGTAILGQAGLTAFNMQQDGYYNIPPEERYNSVFIIIPDSIAKHVPFLESGKVDRYGDPIPARINWTPKTREWALPLGATTFFMENLLSDNPDAIEDLVKVIIPNATPLSIAETNILGFDMMVPLPPFPEIMETGFEFLSGHDLYRGKQIVPTELQHQPEEEQAFPWTSPSLKALADSLRERTGMSVSPIKTEHAYKAIAGGVGGEVLSAIDMVYLMAQEDPDPTTQGYADRLKEAVGSLGKDKIYTEMIEAGMTEEERDEVYNLSVKPDARVPIVSSTVQRITGKGRGGEIQRTRRRAAAEAAGLDEESIGAASREMGDHLRDARDKQIRKDRGELPDGTQGPSIEGMLDSKGSDGKYVDRERIKDWRTEQSTAPGIIYRYVDDSLGKKYPKSLYGATPEQKATYYETLPTAGGTVEDVRTRGEVLTSGYYAIQPEAGTGTEEETVYGMTDLDLMFRQREEYKKSLSPENLELLEAELEKGRTPLQRKLAEDIAYIRETGFWDVYEDQAKELGVSDALREYNQTSLSSRRSTLRKENPELAHALAVGAAARDKMRRDSYEGLDGGKLEDALLKWAWYTTGIEEKPMSIYGLGTRGARDPSYSGEYIKFLD